MDHGSRTTIPARCGAALRSSALVTLGLALAACGHWGFDHATGGDGGADTGDDADAVGLLPVQHALGPSIVDTAGISSIGNEAEGTHVVFADNTPGRNGDLVIFRQGDSTAMLKVYVSVDGGANWTRYILQPAGAGGLNVMSGCQDTVTHAFHLVWLDNVNVDEYMRVVPTYSGGDINGFTTVATYGYFNDGSDSPGSRDITEIVDANGIHRLLFAGTGDASGGTGLYKLAVTTPTAGLAPANFSDWVTATDYTQPGNDQLLANNYATTDVPATFMVAASSNLAGGPSAPAVVVAGLPADHSLLAWTITPASGGNFVVSSPQTVSTSFGGGTGVRIDASLSLANAPSGDTLILYNTEATSASPGIHIATIDASSKIMVDGYAQPPANTQARHAVLATDTSSRPAVLYADGAGTIQATMYWNTAWLAPSPIATVSTTAAAWSASSVWSPGGQDTFALYRDAGAAQATTFSQVYWK